MNRRRFLGWLTGTAAGVALAPTLDVERLLWVPGERTIFLPSPMQRIDIDWMTDELVKIVENDIRFTAFINADYEKCFPRLRKGDTFYIPLPMRFQT